MKQENLSPTYWVWFVGGAPVHPDCMETPQSRCWVCAGPAHRSMPRAKWQGATFTGQNKVRCPESNVICEPCIFVHARSFPVPGRPAKEGKQPPNWRNYSVLFEIIDDIPHLQTATKSEKLLIRSFLERPKSGFWFAAISDSGQKHVIPTCPVNPPGIRGKILLEEAEIAIPSASQWILISAIDEFLTQGASKESIESGVYSVAQWQQIPTLIDEFEERWGGERNSSFWKLALWLAQRDEIRSEQIQQERKQTQKEKTIVTQQRPKRISQNAHSESTAQSTERVPHGGSKSPQALGTVTEPSQTSRETQHNCGRVVLKPKQKTQPPFSQQLSFFGS